MKYSKGLKVFGIIILVFVALVFIAGPVTAYYLRNYLHKQGISIATMNVNVWTASVFATEISFSKIDLKETVALQGNIQNVSVTGIKWVKFIFEKDISMESVTISNAKVKVRILDSDSLETDRSEQAVKFEFGEMNLLESVVEVSSSDKSEFISSIKLLSIESLNLAGGNYNAESIRFEFGSTVYNTGNGQYKMGWVSADNTGPDKIIYIDSLSVLPQHKPHEFFKHEKYQTDRFEMVAPIVHIIPTNILLQSDAYNLDFNINLTNAYLSVYRDKNLKRKENDIKPFLQQILNDVPIEMQVDSVILDGCNIIYAEQAEGVQKPGIVNFTNLKAVILNVHTSTNATGKVSVKAEADLMEKGKLNASIDFPYGEKYFNCNGSLLNLPFVSLNPVSGPLGNVLFSNGKISSMYFNFRANSDSSKGDMKLTYENLNFALVSKNSRDSTGIVSKVLSFIADDFIVPEANPDSKGVFMNGKIGEQRNEERFIFNYMWKSIFSGVKSTVLENNRKKSRSRK